MCNPQCENKSTIIALQGLRAIAFLGIFLSHTEIKIFSCFGPWGVSVFLILSGFLMIVNYYDRGRLEKRNFFANLNFSIKKLSSLYPCHIFMLLCSLPILLIRGEKFSFFTVLCNVTLTHSFIPRSKVFYSFNAVSWYLSACLFCYFCFPWILTLFEKRVKKEKHAIEIIIVTFLIQVSFGAVAGLAGLESETSTEFTKWFIYIFPLSRLEEFVIGCALGYLFLKQDNIRKPKSDWKMVFVILILLGTWLVYTVVFPTGGDNNHPEIWWIYSCLFTLPNGVLIYFLSINTGVWNRIFSLKWLVAVGNVSAYGFLIHQIVIKYLYATQYIGIPNSKWLLIVKCACAFVLTFIVSQQLTRYSMKKKLMC